MKTLLFVCTALLSTLTALPAQPESSAAKTRSKVRPKADTVAPSSSNSARGYRFHNGTRIDIRGDTMVITDPGGHQNMMRKPAGPEAPKVNLIGRCVGMLAELERTPTDTPRFRRLALKAWQCF